MDSQMATVTRNMNVRQCWNSNITERGICEDASSNTQQICDLLMFDDASSNLVCVTSNLAVSSLPASQGESTGLWCQDFQMCHLHMCHTWFIIAYTWFMINHQAFPELLLVEPGTPSQLRITVVVVILHRQGLLSVSQFLPLSKSWRESNELRKSVRQSIQYCPVFWQKM